MGNRYIRDLVLNIAPNDVENIVQEYLKVNDFKLVNEKGEIFYKTGGVMFPLRGFSYNYLNGILHLEAWNGKIGKEMNIGDGKLLGAAAKVPYYNSILSLQGALENINQQRNQSNGQQEPFQPWTNGHMQNSAYTQTVVGNQQPIYAQANGGFQQYQSMQANGAFQQSQNMQANSFQQPQNMQANGFQQPQNMQANGGFQQSQNVQTNGGFQQPIYTQQYVNNNNNQTTSSVVNEINKANNRNAMLAFWLSFASIVLLFESKFSLVVNIGSYALGFKYGLKSQKRGYAIAAIIINTIAMAITFTRIFL